MELNYFVMATPTYGLNVSSQNRKNWKTYFFKILLGILSDLHETWDVHSLAGPDKKLSKEFCSVKECANY